MEAHTLPVAVSLKERAPGTQPQHRAPYRSARQVALRDAIGRRLLAVSDTFAAAMSLVLCTSILGDDHLRRAALLGVLLVVPISKLIGLYERDEVVIHRTTLEEAPRLFQLATCYTLATWLLSPAILVGTLGRGQAAILWLAFGTSAIVGRIVVRHAMEKVTPPERCLIVGNVDAAQQLVSTMAREDLRARLVGRMDIAEWRDPCSYGDLAALVEEHNVHRLIIAPDNEHPETMLDLIRASKGLGVRVSVLPRVLEVVGSSVEFDNFAGVPLLGVHPLRLSRSSMAVKRAFDVLVASLVLVIAAPLLAIVALAVKLDSRGPVVYRQTRVGREGAHFGMLKFRSMIPGAHAMRDELSELNEAGDGLFKIAEDPRITRVGRFLRRTSLDELPQLLNVVKGDMSLVGPRPLVVDEDALITGWDRRRLNLTPGMTGHWQILGSARIPLGEMVKIDYLYVSGWSLWADLKLLLRTIPYVLARRGQ